MTRFFRQSLVASCVALMGMTMGTPASAQDEAERLDMRAFTGTGIGLSSSVPSVLSGISVFRYMGDRGFGVFATGRLNFSSPANDDYFEEGTTIAEAFGRGHELFQGEDNYRMFTVGLIRAVDSALALYAGAGYTEKRGFWEFWDPDSDETGFRGFYWVEDPNEEESGINVTGGAMIRLTSWLFLKGGGELFPRGANLSVYVALPY